MPGTLPGFLTSFGLDLLSRPPSGGLKYFQQLHKLQKDLLKQHSSKAQHKKTRTG